VSQQITKVTLAQIAALVAALNTFARASTGTICAYSLRSMAPLPDGTYRIRNVGTDRWLTAKRAEGNAIEVEISKNASAAQQWRLTNYGGYMTLESLPNGVYFVPQKDEADFPIISTTKETQITSADGANGKIISFSLGNTCLVMTVNQNNHMVQLANRLNADAKQQWEFQRDETLL